MVGVTSGWIAPPDGLVCLVIFTIFAGMIGIVVAVARRLHNAPQWSLADALSEETDLADAGGSRTVLTPSTSRLIAFLGMIAILGLFLGFGVFVLWGVAETGHVPESSDEFSKYLFGGVTLFAPYVVNKFAAAFSIR